jgi:hypothetical protein
MTRLTRWWKAHVAGGVVVEEVTRNVRIEEWHPHLHLISDVDVFQAVVVQGKLIALWAGVARDLRELPMPGAGMTKGRGITPSLAKWTWLGIARRTRGAALDRV